MSQHSFRIAIFSLNSSSVDTRMDVLTVPPVRPEPLRHKFRGVAHGCSTVGLHSAS